MNSDKQLILLIVNAGWVCAFCEKLKLFISTFKVISLIYILCFVTKKTENYLQRSEYVLC